MITAEQSGLTDSQYTAVQDHVDESSLAAIHELVLTRYAPVWSRVDSPFAASYVRMSVENNGLDTDPDLYRYLRAVAWNGTTSVVVATLPLEDSGDQAWLNTTPTTISPAPHYLSYSPAALDFWKIPIAKTSFTDPFYSASHTIPGYVEHRFLETVGDGGYQVHLAGLTAKGNWLLAHCSLESVGGGTWVSNVYWPYQVRSFDAVRMDGYDIIAMETDLPPIDDFTVVGNHTVPTFQRIQGIVLFKYDYTYHRWSSHYILDQVDNLPDRALGHIKLTLYDGMVYATYFRNHNGTMVLCITKSVDGINWENPIYLPQMASSTTLDMAAHYPVQLIRNGKYMYLIGAGASTTNQICYRSLATDFMGSAATDNTFDVTDYVTNASLSIDSHRVAQVNLGDPTVNVVQLGYGLGGLLRGDISNHDLFSSLRAMRAKLSIGYSVAVDYLTQFTLAYFPVLANTLSLNLSGGSALSDDGAGSLRTNNISIADEAVTWTSTSSGTIETLVYSAANMYMVPGTVQIAGDTDDGLGAIDVLIPDGVAEVFIILMFLETQTSFVFPEVPVTPGACTLYTDDWSITDDGYGAFADVPNGITGTINYTTGEISLAFSSAYSGIISTDIAVNSRSAAGTIDYDTSTLSVANLMPSESKVLQDAAYTLDYSYASILGTINYTTGAGTLLVDGVTQIAAVYDTAGGSQSETILSSRENLLVEELNGLVSKVRETPGLEGSITLEIQDLSVLASSSGNSDSNEWLGSECNGDNFSPLYTDDTSGASGLKHTIPKTGAWTGSTHGLVHACDDTEGLAITDLVKRSMNSTIQADIGFYCGIDSPVKLINGTIENSLVIDGFEYAGLGLRMKDQHSGWWVRVVPNANRTATVQLMFRRSVTTIIPGVDGEPATTEVTHIDTVVVGAAGTSPALPANYDDYYVGKLRFSTYYNRYFVRISVGLGSQTQLFSYEAIGMGDLEFHVSDQDAAYPMPELEETSYNAWPFMSGYCAYIAKGTGLYVDHGTDSQVEVATPGGGSQTIIDLEAAYILSHGSSIETRSVNTNTSYTYGSLQSIKVETQYGNLPESGMKYEIGDGSLPGTPLAMHDVLSLRFKVDVWFENGEDEKATVRAKAKVWYSDSSANRYSVEYTEMQKWQHFEWTCDNPGNKTIDGITFFFYDPLSDTEAMATTFYVDNIKVMYKEVQRNIYFGNALASSDERCYTTEDAEKTLYAYSGQHDVSADDYMTEVAWSGASISEVSDPHTLTAPLVVDFDMTSNYFMVYPLAIETNDLPIQIEFLNNQLTCRVRVKTTGDDVMASAMHYSSVGRVRIALTTLATEGVVYTQDATLVKDWLNVMVYINDREILSGSFPIYPETVFGDRLLYGSANGTMSFDSLRVSVANRMIDVFSIDPGETASNPLSRLLGVSNLVAVAQPDGGLRLKPVQIGPAIDVDWTLPDTSQQVSRETDLMAVSHVRYTTARDERDVFIHRAGALTWSHLFNKRDDPNVITESEIDAGVLGIVTAIRRGMRTIELSGTYNPFVELDDTLGSAAGDSYLVDGISATLATDSSGTPVLSAKYKLGGDWFGSLDPDDGLEGNWFGPPGDGGGGGEDSGGEGNNDPTLLTATAIAGSQLIDLAWNGTPYGKTGFRIERSFNGTDFTALTTVSERTLIYTDHGLEPETLYYYRVCPYNALGNGPWSNVANATTDTMDAAVFPVTHILDNFNRPNQGPPPSRYWDTHAPYQTYWGGSNQFRILTSQCASTTYDEPPYKNIVGNCYQMWGTALDSNCEAYFTISQDTPVFFNGVWTHSSIELQLRRIITNDAIRGYRVKIYANSSGYGTTLHGQGNEAIATSATGYQVGDQFGLRCWNNQITVYRNGVAIIDVSDNGSLSSAKPVIYIFPGGSSPNYSNMAFDDFGGGSL